MPGRMQFDGGAAVVTERGSISMRVVTKCFRGLALTSLLAFAAAVPGCSNGLGAFQSGVGNTAKRPPQSAFRVLGETGLEFAAIISDADATWQIQGTVPMNVVIVNNTTPVRMIATKLSADAGILSLQLTLGFLVKQISSTNDPYGTATLQSSPLHPGFAPPPPPASPDIRLYVRGPLTERFSGLFEDSKQAFIISDRAPAIFLFDQPSGAVNASLSQIQDLGPFSVDLLVDGAIVATAHGGPTVTIRQP
jgi:hypothetical protein